MLAETLPMVGADTEAGQSVLTAIKALSKHVKPGAVTPAGEANQLQRAQLQNAQNSAMLQKLRAQQMPGMPGGGGAAAPGARPPGAPPMAA